MDLRQLRYFVGVAEAGQISLAAHRLYVSQPALSQAVRALERELRVELLERRARGVELTPAGQDVLAEARAAIAAADEVARAAAAHTGDAGAQLVVGFLTGMFELVIEPVQRFARARPDVRLRLLELGMGEQESELREGRVDLALLCPPPPDLPMQPLFTDPMVATMLADHALAQRAALLAQDLGEEVFPGAVTGVPEPWADVYWLTGRLGGRPRRTAQPAASLYDVYELIVSGRAITTSPAFLARRLSRGTLTALPLLDVEPVVVGFTWLRQKAVVRAFVETLRDAPPEGARPAAPSGERLRRAADGPGRPRVASTPPTADR